MIDYKLISDALTYYKELGYQQIEVPWLVTEAVDSITRPPDISPLEVVQKSKNLIASGEQGFLYLMLKGYLPKGKYQTVTPCFRNDQYDFTHSKVFVKLELINTQDLEDGLEKTIQDSQIFFETLFNKKHINKTYEEGVYDLNYKDIELGSYGVRKHKHLEWIFGTGLAEPRTSRILKQL